MQVHAVEGDVSLKGEGLAGQLEVGELPGLAIPAGHRSGERLPRPLQLQGRGKAAGRGLGRHLPFTGDVRRVLGKGRAKTGAEQQGEQPCQQRKVTSDHAPSLSGVRLAGEESYARRPGHRCPSPRFAIRIETPW